MTAARLLTVTLARAFDAAEQAEEAGRIVFAIALDASGRPDAQAWQDDPAPWPAQRLLPGQPAEAGDVALDEDGWQLRFAAAGHQADPPLHRIAQMPKALRPGEVLTLIAPDGEEAAWRIVNVAAAEG